MQGYTYVKKESEGGEIKGFHPLSCIFNYFCSLRSFCCTCKHSPFSSILKKNQNPLLLLGPFCYRFIISVLSLPIKVFEIGLDTQGLWIFTSHLVLTPVHLAPWPACCWNYPPVYQWMARKPGGLPPLWAAIAESWPSLPSGAPQGSLLGSLLSPLPSSTCSLDDLINPYTSLTYFLMSPKFGCPFEPFFLALDTMWLYLWGFKLSMFKTEFTVFVLSWAVSCILFCGWGQHRLAVSWGWKLGVTWCANVSYPSLIAPGPGTMAGS